MFLTIIGGREIVPNVKNGDFWTLLDAEALTTGDVDSPSIDPTGYQVRQVSPEKSAINIHW